MKKRMLLITFVSVIFLIFAFLFWNAFNSAGIHATDAEKAILSQLISPEGSGALKVIFLYATTFIFLPAVYGFFAIGYIISWPWQRDESMEKVGLIEN